MSTASTIALIVVIIVALVAVYTRRRPVTAGRRRMLWLITIFGVLAIALLVWALLSPA